MVSQQSGFEREKRNTNFMFPGLRRVKIPWNVNLSSLENKPQDSQAGLASSEKPETALLEILTAEVKK